MRHLQLLALPGFQGAALQGWGMGEGRGGEHHVLAVAEVGAQLTVEEPAAADVTQQGEAFRAVVIDLQPQAAEAPARVAVEHVGGGDAVALEALDQVTAGIDAIAVAIQAQAFDAGVVPGFPNQVVLHPCDSLSCAVNRLPGDGQCGAVRRIRTLPGDVCQPLPTIARFFVAAVRFRRCAAGPVG